MPKWKEVYEETSFASDSFAKVLWYMTHSAWIPQPPTYKVFFAPMNNFTTEFTTMVTIQGRNPRESETTFFGRGSTGPMALRETAYIAIT
jgi:hypothetical protein